MVSLYRISNSVKLALGPQVIERHIYFNRDKYKCQSIESAFSSASENFQELGLMRFILLDRIYFGGRISRQARILRVTRFIRENKWGIQVGLSPMTLKNFCVDIAFVAGVQRGGRGEENSSPTTPLYTGHAG